MENLRRNTDDRRQVTVAVPAELDRRVVTRRATDAIKMACPFCGASESAVVRSRGAINDDIVRRRRECAECGKRFPTFEAVDQETLARELAAEERRALSTAPKFQIVIPPGSQN